MTETDDAETLRRFFSSEGRLHTMPTRHTKRRLVLDHVAQRFQPGRASRRVQESPADRGFLHLLAVATPDKRQFCLTGVATGTGVTQYGGEVTRAHGPAAATLTK